MEDKETQYRQICRVCEKFFLANENPVLVAKYSRYFKEGYDAYGLEEDQIRELKARLLQEYEIGPLEAAELGLLFFKTGKYEFGSLAVMLLKKFRPRFTREIFDIVRLWFDQGVENWAHSDYICSKITPVFLELKIVTLEDFADWRVAESKWTRRAVPVTMLFLRKSVAPEILLNFIQPMMLDSERVVHQGLGWFLKQLWVVHPAEVEGFLHQHKNTASRLIIQYATEKMKKERRKRFRKD
ncbi:MAG TPA: DNA alkylation repair protein [Candidatus Cloacimonadota bacterium]|nr:DNA alkylation repair protein [Candidatus Cloacimonadota bacterium]HPS38449.1 DNA alkylation repair protein [Candidatus Cloacimonadota bacterium]